MSWKWFRSLQAPIQFNGEPSVMNLKSTWKSDHVYTIFVVLEPYWSISNALQKCWACKWALAVQHLKRYPAPCQRLRNYSIQQKDFIDLKVMCNGIFPALSTIDLNLGFSTRAEWSRTPGFVGGGRYWNSHNLQWNTAGYGKHILLEWCLGLLDRTFWIVELLWHPLEKANLLAWWLSRYVRSLWCTWPAGP